MSKKNLTKKEVKKFSTKELNYRYCRLIKKGETLPVSEITMADAKEILWIEDELKERVIRGVGHDFYPPDRVEKKETMKTILHNKQAPPLGLKIPFKVVVFNSIGTKTKGFSVSADSKNEANILARKEIRKLNIPRATYKIL